MTIITIEGRVGAGAYLLSRAVALEMGIDFVDRLVLADVATASRRHNGRACG